MNPIKAIAAIVSTLCHVSFAFPSTPARNSWFYAGGEYSAYSSTGFVSRKTSSPANLSLAVSNRMHSDFWLGLTGFLGHDPSPDVGRNYDTSIGMMFHWLPFTTSSSSTLFYEGFRLTESDTYRPFVVCKLMFGRALLRRVLNDFVASADFVAVNGGVGSQFALTEALSLSGSIEFQKNVGLSALPYSGQKIALTFGLVTGF